MPDLSPFQTLPIHIAEAIAHYCIGLQRHYHIYDYSIKASFEKTWLVLRDVSHSWMHLARRNLNKCVSLYLSKNPVKDKFATTLHSRRVIEQSSAIILHVKDVNIHFDDIVEKPNAEDLEKLARVWPVDLVFPKARSLTCYLGCKSTKASNNACNDKYFKWFVERMRSSFPGLQRTTIMFGENRMISVSPSVLFCKDWSASLFLSALFRIAMWNVGEDLSSAYMDNEHIILKNAPELTSIRYSDDYNGEFASRVVKRSANVLEFLHYSKKGHGVFKDFMFDDDGQLVVYPRLRDLCVVDRSNDKGELTADTSIVPFPALQRLTMHSSCMFKDDTIFRGSNDTLQSLDIGLHRGFADIFRVYKVYSQGAYPNILHITATREHLYGLIIPADEFAEIAFGLVSPATRSITLIGYISYQHISSTIPMCPYLENIQILYLTKAMLNLLEILNIFKYFPRVTDFGCSFRGVDSELDAIQYELIPSHLGVRYSQLISRLKCWHMYDCENALVEEVVVLFVTLAVLCPNFTFVKYWGSDSKEYESEIEHILSSGLYDEHAKRLGHLFH